MRILLSAFLVFTAISLVVCLPSHTLANSKDFVYTVKGRVVDESGKPVPKVTVELKSPQYDEGDIVYLDSSDESGRFVIQKKSARPIWNWKLYVSDFARAPENTYELLAIGSAFCGEYYKSLCGRKVQAVANKVHEIGDIRLQVRHYPLLVHFFDITGNPLIYERNPFGDGFTPYWRVRDPLGDIIGEGGNGHVHYRFAQSAVMVALPLGKWTLEIFDDDGSDLGGVFDIEVRPSKVTQEVTLKLGTFDSSAIFEGQKQYPKNRASVARRQIEELGFKFSEAEFQRRVVLGNHKMVELYLLAGMNPNVLTKNLDTMRMAIMRPKVLKLLLEAGADVNRRVERDITPLLQAVGWLVIPKETVRLLLDAGGNINAKAKDGRDVFVLAEDRSEIMNLLKDYRSKKLH